jgi:hypothetical protein
MGEQRAKRVTSPSCSQKRTILMAEHLTEDVLLKLPHRQFVFTVPKALRVFFRNNRKLFADISRLIFSIIRDFYNEAAEKEIRTGMVIAHLRFFAKRKYPALPHIRHYRLLVICCAGIRIFTALCWKEVLMMKGILFLFHFPVCKR